MITIAHQLRYKTCQLYSAVESGDKNEIKDTSLKFGEFLNLESTQRYLEGWSKFSAGIKGVKTPDYLTKTFSRAIHHKNNIEATLTPLRRTGESLLPTLSRELMGLANELAILDTNEEYLEKIYAQKN